MASVLRGHHPQLTIYPVATSDDLAAIDTGVLRRARLIAFSSPVIVPPDVLSALGFGAYNFHPGPPEYPGWAPAHFALYEGAAEFGATAHAMAERVDSGPIVAVSRFPIPSDIRRGRPWRGWPTRISRACTGGLANSWRRTPPPCRQIR